MIRLLLRFFSLFLLSTAFITLIIDATRSFAAATLIWTPAGDALATFAPERWATAQAYIEQHVYPFLWNSILVELIRLPAWLWLGLAGSIVTWLAKNPARKFGFSSR
ncbi:MAG: hypothetical protein L0Y60_05855 [Beijerinckiaceae bacterium]|nr:hypothetical protein [Beijerinckiaceae bacterium]